MDITVSANVVAWYAAIVATISVFISGIRVFRDRANVRVEARSGWKVTPGGPHDPDKTYIVINASNRGRRPVSLEKAYLQLRPDKTAESDKPARNQLLISDSIQSGPRELTEGHSTTYVVIQDGVPLDRVKHAAICDGAGRTWKGKLQIAK